MDSTFVHYGFVQLWWKGWSMPYIPISPLFYPTVSLAPNPSYPSCPHSPWDKLGQSIPMHNPQCLSRPCVPWHRMGYCTLFPPNPIFHPVLMHCRNGMGHSAVSHALPMPIVHPVLMQHKFFETWCSFAYRSSRAAFVSSGAAKEHSNGNGFHKCASFLLMHNPRMFVRVIHPLPLSVIYCIMFHFVVLFFLLGLLDLY